jgi:hypothetical protein
MPPVYLWGCRQRIHRMDTTLQQLQDDLTRSLHGLSATQAQLRPQDDPTRWNICQIVQHLLLTYASTCASIEDRVAKGTPTRSRLTPSQFLPRLLVIRLGLIPVRREAPALVTPPARPPAPHPSGDDLVMDLCSGLTRMDLVLSQAENLFSSAPCLSHFALGPLSIPQWRRFHLVHGRHHIRQIAAIRREYSL